MHCPTASAGNKKAPARHFGCWLSKSRREKYGRRRRGEKISQQPRDISILTPRIPQAAGRRLQNGPAPPCYRVGSGPVKMSLTGKHRLRSFPLFHPSLVHTVFLTSCAVPLPYAVHPSPHTERAAHPLQWSSRPNAAFCAETERGKGTLSSSLPLSLSLSPLRWSCARVLRLGEVSASQSQVHFSLKCDVYLQVLSTEQRRSL